MLNSLPHHTGADTMSEKATSALRQSLEALSNLQLRTMRRDLTKRLSPALGRALLADYNEQLTQIDAVLDTRRAGSDFLDALDQVQTLDVLRMSTDMCVRATLSKDALEADECLSTYRAIERYLDERLQPQFAAWLASDDALAKATRDLIDNDTSTGLVAHRAARLGYQSGRLEGGAGAHRVLVAAAEGPVALDAFS